MFERDVFLRAYNIDETDFEAAAIPWEELAAIYDDYLSIEGKLRAFIPTDTEPKIRGICWKRSSASGQNSQSALQ